MANCRTLSSIDINTCTGNKGGIYTEVIIAARSEVNPVREVVSDAETGYATLTAPQSAIFVKFRKQSSSLTSEGTFDEANGVYFYTNNLNLVIARQDVAKRNAIQALALAGDLVVLVRDGNNMVQLLGMDDTVSTTALTATTGTAATDGNNYTMTLTDTSNELPYYVKDTDWTTFVALAEGTQEG